MKEVRNIETHIQPVFVELYTAFLTARGDDEEWEFSVAGDELQANLVHANCLSAASLTCCRAFDIESLNEKPGFEAMRTLHQSLAALVPTDDAEEAA